MPLDKITDGLMELVKTQMVPLSLVSIKFYAAQRVIWQENADKINCMLIYVPIV